MVLIPKFNFSVHSSQKLPENDVNTSKHVGVLYDTDTVLNHHWCCHT